MDYYNKIDNAYLAELHKPMRKMYVKMEILSHYEGAIGEITSDLSSTDGSITINKEQGCRRSCSLSIIDMVSMWKVPILEKEIRYRRRPETGYGCVMNHRNFDWDSGKRE